VPAVYTFFMLNGFSQLRLLIIIFAIIVTFSLIFCFAYSSIIYLFSDSTKFSFARMFMKIKLNFFGFLL